MGTTRWLWWPSAVQLVLLSLVVLLVHGACWWHAGRLRNPYSLYYQPDWTAIGRLAVQRRLESQAWMRERLLDGNKTDTAIRFPMPRTRQHRLCVGILYDEHDYSGDAGALPLTVSELLLHTDANESVAMTLLCRAGPACDRLDNRLGRLVSLERLTMDSSSSSALHLAALSHLSSRASCDYHLILSPNLFVASNWVSRLLGVLADDYDTYAPDWFAARLLTQLDRSFHWDSLEVMAILGVGLSLGIICVGLGALLYWAFLLVSRRTGAAGQCRSLGWDDFTRPSIVTLLLLVMSSLAVPLIVGKPAIMFMTSGFHMYDPSACSTGGFPVAAEAAKSSSCQEHSLAILYHHTNSEHLLDLLLGEDQGEPDAVQADDFDHVDYVKRRPLPRGGPDGPRISLSEGMDRVLAHMVAYNYAHGYRTPLGILLPNLFQHHLATYGPAHERPEAVYSLSFPDV